MDRTSGLGNWCSAVVCFSPTRRQILTSIVAHSNGSTYFATPDGASVEKVIKLAFNHRRNLPLGAKDV
jgi:hypothetical protein